ncbi:restriction endonuclease subunit S [Bacteroides finegoldii]|uniref:restriction endonuclease subunit S n=1 Tax=Bacteroides finegoldii TaxID=338188 RepID=UPI001EDAE4F0|nr:restriction endonuclease subunit S [Bacteroides finegoldii]MCG4682857.1 restriction endonuclease subunit S [Bacteroides finegoldii]
MFITLKPHTPHYENVPFEVPKGWVWTTFGNVCKKLTDGSHNPPPKCSNGYTVISAQNIKNGKIVFTDKDRYTDELGFQKENPRTQITNGDIILGIIGGSIGNVAIYDLSVPVIAQRSISIIDTYVSNIYCFYLLQSTIFQSLFLEKSIGNAQAGVYLGELDKLYIPLPPLSEQQRIVTEIKRWFALIEQIEFDKADLQTTIKQTKSKILDLAIHGKLVPQDPNDEPGIELLKRINPDFTPCDNGHYTQLPDGWAVAPMQMLCSLIDGEKQNGIERINLDVKYLRGERDAKTLTSGKYVAANSLLILVDGENSGEVFRTPIDGYQGSTFKLLSINYDMNTEYVLQVINLHRTILRENKVGSAIPHLNKKLFKAIEVPIPPYKEQQRIVEAANKVFMSLDVIMGSL